MEFADYKLKMGQGPSGRKRVGLPCCNDDFIWGDGQRKPETKPAGLSKGKDLGDSPLSNYDESDSGNCNGLCRMGNGHE